MDKGVKMIEFKSIKSDFKKEMDKKLSFYFDFCEEWEINNIPNFGEGYQIYAVCKIKGKYYEAAVKINKKDKYFDKIKELVNKFKGLI